jgi:hypothetical protein
MNVMTITMAPQKAREKLQAYKAALARYANEEYEAAAQGYEALAAGHALLDLDEIFRAAPQDALGRPRLAIARADRPRVRFGLQDGQHTVGIFDSATNRMPRTYVGSLVVRVPYVDDPVKKADIWKTVGHALVPLTPPDVYAGRALGERYVLWEVEQWAERPVTSKPDRDPYLLKHLAGSLYVVEGAWDLTALERAITNGRREQ